MKLTKNQLKLINGGGAIGSNSGMRGPTEDKELITLGGVKFYYNTTIKVYLTSDNTLKKTGTFTETSWPGNILHLIVDGTAYSTALYSFKNS